LEYLGHNISAAGVLPLPSHVAAIQDFPRLTIIKELQAFLGMVNFYRRFLPSIACTLRPLTDGLRGSRKEAGLVGGDGCRFCRRKAGPPLSNTPGSPHGGGGAIGGGGRLGDARGGVLAAAVAWSEGLVAPGVHVISGHHTLSKIS
jgi:hypothetical protein